MIVGLTGGMACGKTTAAELFRREGFGVADTDELVRELLTDDARVVAQVKERFGERVIAPGGGVDRSALAAIVFASEAELDWLEGLLHPEVDRLWRERVASEPGKNWVVQVPLLFEKQLEGNFDLTVCVAASPDVQRERIGLRGMTEKEAGARLARQYAIEKKMASSDRVILNDGSPAFLGEQIRYLVRAAPFGEVIG